MKIKIEAVIDVDDSYNFSDQDEIDWFNSVLDDKKHTHLILWSNDIGDDIGHTFNFKYEIINQNKEDEENN